MTTTIVPHHRLRRQGGFLIATRYAKPNHLLQKPPAWSYNVEVIEAMKEAGVNILEVVFGDKVFSCPLERFWRHARRHNRGWGDQLFLPLQYWDVRTAGEPELPQESREGGSLIAQLALF
ncbi:hypothetical protein [Candidatus Caldatribacterium saccharofermentans]|uniref:hypothetical protein n=1 Tax=Candidatus Caldatribacterium saccharofermentans TaxID=1454753 RepID=UPI003D04CAE3